MRLASVALAFSLAASLVGCELTPPKPRGTAGSATPPAPPPGATVADAGAAPVAPPDRPDAQAGSGSGAGSGAGSGSAVAEPTKECLEVGVAIAELVISSTEDASQKAALEQDRTRLVRRAAEGCTRDGWSEGARKCFLAAKTVAALEACGRELAK